MISFSTCWNSSRHTAGDKMLREIKTKLGFDLIELGHGIRISLMPGIQKMFDAGEVRFSSLHNFCPLPVEVTGASPDCYTFSSSSPQERERAVRQTLADDRFRRAARSSVRRPSSWPRADQAGDRAVDRARAKRARFIRESMCERKVDAVAKREAAAPVYLANVKECLKPIMEHAAAKNIRLGIEGRRGLRGDPERARVDPVARRTRTRRWSATGTISGTSRSRRTSASSITRSGCAPSGRARLAVMSRIASGRRRIISRLSPATSIWRNWFRFCRRPAYLSGK